MKSRPSIFAVRFAVFGLIIVPVALFIMRMMHVLLLGGRDIGSEPLLLILLGLASLFTASMLTFAAFVSFFAAEDVIRHRFAKGHSPASELAVPRTGVAEISEEWFHKGVRLFNSRQYSEADRCFRMAQRLGLQTAQLAALRRQAEAEVLAQDEETRAAGPAQSGAALRHLFIPLPEPIQTQLTPDEIARGQALLEQYLTTRKGQFALMKGGALVGFFRNFAAALQEGYEHSQSGHDFTIIPIKPPTSHLTRFFECPS